MEAVLEKKKPLSAAGTGLRAKRPWVVLADGRKVSRTWAAFLEAAKDPGDILDMRAVVYGMYETDGR